MDDWELRPARDLGLPLRERLRSPLRESGLVSLGARHGWWLLVRSYLALWHRVTVRPPEHLPRDFPFVLVANHCSHLDTLVLASVLPWRLRDGTFPLAAGDVFFESQLAELFAGGLMNALPVWRRRKADRSFQALRRRLGDGDSGYVIFPEGTRSRDGRMTAFKAGVGMLVAGTDVPVIPCHLDGCFGALPPGASAPRRRRITLRAGRPMRFDGIPNDRRGWEKVAQSLEEAVKELSRQDGEDAPGASA